MNIKEGKAYRVQIRPAGFTASKHVCTVRFLKTDLFSTGYYYVIRGETEGRFVHNRELAAVYDVAFDQYGNECNGEPVDPMEEADLPWVAAADGKQVG